MQLTENFLFLLNMILHVLLCNVNLTKELFRLYFNPKYILLKKKNTLIKNTFFSQLNIFLNCIKQADIKLTNAIMIYTIVLYKSFSLQNNIK